MNEPIRLLPNRVWRTYTGGKQLDKFLGASTQQDSNYPEDWIASLTPAVNIGREHYADEGLSKIHFAGEKILLLDYIKKDPVAMLGKEHYYRYGIATGFLLKFLDAAIRLHIQCHPTVQFSKARLDSNHGKTEGYYILDIRESVSDPYIYMGFQHPPQRADFKKAVEEQDISFLESCFEKIPVKKGDAFYVPGGLPHAIGAGVLMIEIMEPTDFVARFEFEKAGYTLPEPARFMNRGIDFALDMLDFSEISLEEVYENFFVNPELIAEERSYTERAIFRNDITPYFRLHAIDINGTYTLKKKGFCVLMIIEGSGRLISNNQVIVASKGDKFFIPAAADQLDLISEGHVSIAVAMPPGIL
ncbi:MAG: class I mannose-6-phosphate isomerase [Niabella sp.]